jgi:HAD superfamily hydrolase (TIGR01490 family)
MDAPKSYAFFDVDDTLIAVKSMFSFQDYWYDAMGDTAGRQAFLAEMDELRGADAPWEILNRRYYAHFAGRSVASTAACAQAWFAALERERPHLYHTAVVEELRALQSRGVEAVFVSGSFPELLTPAADRLNIRHILATTMEVQEGRYTGAILPPQTIGEGKATAVKAFLAARRVSPAVCSAYGDDISDAPMLALVGAPTVVSGGRGLQTYAEGRGWRVMSPA